MEPTVFLDPKTDAQIYKDDIFAPVAVMRTSSAEEEVIGMANDTEYGLMAGVFTRDINRALRVSAQDDSGVFGIKYVSYLSPTYFHWPNTTELTLHPNSKLASSIRS